MLMRVFDSYPRAKKANIELYCSIKLGRIARNAHSQTNLLHHIPSRFAPLHTQALLNAFNRNSICSGHHQKHAVVPRAKRRLAMHHDHAPENGRYSQANLRIPSGARS